MNHTNVAQQDSAIVPLIAIAWPDRDARELNQLYEAVALLLVEEFDLLVLTSESENERVQAQLNALELPEQSIHFLDFKVPSLAIAQHFLLNVIQNSDGSEAVELNAIESKENIKSLLSHGGNEYFVAQHKIFVPIYDDCDQDEILMDISQQFPAQEVIALNCEILKNHKMKFSDLILFANE